MNTPNAYGFLGAGIFMELLSFWTEISVVREWWLMIMGGVLISVGGVFLAKIAYTWFVQRLVIPLLVVLPSRGAAQQQALPDGRGSLV
jgi:hypothetical protein